MTKPLTESQKIIRDFRNNYARVSASSEDLVIVEGRGVYVKNSEGDELLDFTAGYGVNQFGYSQEIADSFGTAMRNHISKTRLVCFDSNAWPNPWIAEYAKKLCSLVPVDSPKVFFCNSGTEANEAALKLASHPERPIVIAFHGAFHGRTLGALSLTCGKKIYHDEFPRIGDVKHIPFPEKGVSVRELKDHMTARRSPHTIGKIFIELVQGEGGMRVADPELVGWLADFCKKNGILLIVDEVQTGFGRTGKMFACEQYDLNPDALLLAKGMALGYPMGAVVFRSSLNWKKEGQHSNTMGGNMGACIAAEETLKFFKLLKPEKNAAERGKELAELLPALQKEFPSLIAGFHGLGLMWGIDFSSKEVRDLIVRKARHENLLLIGASEQTIRITPPLTITSDELRLGIERLRQTLIKI